MERLSFGRVCGVTTVVLIAIWGVQKAGDHIWPRHPAAVVNSALVPEYELRRQRDEAWIKRYALWLT